MRTSHAILAGFALIASAIIAVGISNSTGATTADQRSLYEVAATPNIDARGGSAAVELR
jgi:hypothetical protein